MNTAAFFDIDGTIYRDGLITEVFKKMVKSELIDPSAWRDKVAPAYYAWDRRTGDYDVYLQKMVDIFKSATVGISKEHIEHIAKKVIEQKGERVYLFTRKEIERHKAEGHIIIAISGSPNELVKEMARKYDFDDFRGTVYCTDENGKYNGDIIPMWDRESKHKAVEELKKKYDIDLNESYSYGDTNGDLMMFEMTGHPYAINPTRELISRINSNPDLKKKTNIIVERKDVIYSIDLDTTRFL